MCLVSDKYFSSISTLTCILSVWRLIILFLSGCGDLRIADVSFLPDPCPLPDKEKKRSLLEKEKLIYAPFSGVGGIVYDKDAVYVDLGGSHSHSQKVIFYKTCLFFK